jgi:hypothetical protein
MADKAIRRKALKESLEACAPALKRQVRDRRLFKRKNPLGALDLGRLARAAGLSRTAKKAIAVAAAAPFKG